jgi:hypothetical protein
MCNKWTWRNEHGVIYLRVLYDGDGNFITGVWYNLSNGDIWLVNERYDEVALVGCK